jgi:hypothetical protein
MHKVHSQANKITHTQAFDIVITIPVVYFMFKETKQRTLEDIDLLFGERALGALPADLPLKEVPEIVHEEHRGKEVDAAA